MSGEHQLAKSRLVSGGRLPGVVPEPQPGSVAADATPPVNMEDAVGGMQLGVAGVILFLVGAASGGAAIALVHLQGLAG